MIAEEPLRAKEIYIVSKTVLIETGNRYAENVSRSHVIVALMPKSANELLEDKRSQNDEELGTD